MSQLTTAAVVQGRKDLVEYMEASSLHSTMSLAPSSDCNLATPHHHHGAFCYSLHLGGAPAVSGGGTYVGGDCQHKRRSR